MAAIKCPECGKCFIPYDNQKYCPYCGGKLDVPSYDLPEGWDELFGKK